MAYAVGAFLAQPEALDDSWKDRFFHAQEVLQEEYGARFHQGVALAQQQLGVVLSELQSALSQAPAGKPVSLLSRSTKRAMASTRHTREDCRLLLLCRRIFLSHYSANGTPTLAKAASMRRTWPASRCSACWASI